MFFNNSYEPPERRDHYRKLSLLKWGFVCFLKFFTPVHKFTILSARHSLCGSSFPSDILRPPEEPPVTRAVAPDGGVSGLFPSPSFLEGFTGWQLWVNGVFL